MTENDKTKVPEKTALSEAGRETPVDTSRLDSPAEPGTLQHVQNMELLANQDSPSDLSLKCPDLSGAERDRIQNNRFQIVDTTNDTPDNLDSATLMAITAESDPSVMPVALLRQYADSLPEGHPDKSRLTDLSRQQAAALSPEFANRYDRPDGSVLLDIGVTKSNLLPQNWFEAAQQISELPVDKQFEVIGTALSEGFKQYSYEERERTIGQIIGTVQGIGDVLQFYATISDFAYDIIARREDRLQERGAKFGEAFAKTIIGGMGLFNLAHDYCYNIGYAGDYYKPFRDVVSLANAIDTKWKMLPLREQERIKAQLITNLLADGVITARGVEAMSKLPKISQVFDAVALEAKAAGTALKDVSDKAANHIIATLDEITKLPPGAGGLRPAYGYASDGLGAIPTGPETPKGLRQKLEEFMDAMVNPDKDKAGEGKFQPSDRSPLQKSKLALELEKFKFPSNSKLVAILQQDDSACTFACGEMLSNGKLKQHDLANLFRDSIFLPGDDLDRLQRIQKCNSSWAAELKVSGENSHLVVVDGYSESGRIMIRDPENASKYELEVGAFMKFWTLRGVHHNF